MPPAKRRRLGPIKIQLPNSFTSEPLFLLLKNTQLTNPWMIFTVFFVIGFIDDILIGILTGNWTSRPGVVGVFDVNNLPALIMSLIVEPGVWAFFVGFPDALFKLFDTFQSEHIFLTEQADIQAQVDWLKRAEASWVLRITVLPLAIGIAIYAMRLVGEYQPKLWFDVGWHHWLYFVRIAAAAYVGVYAVAWSLMALSALRRIFCSARVRVNPYDGDNAGGLRFVGTFILQVSRLTLIVVPLLVAETLFAVRLGRGILGQFNLWLEILILPFLLGVMVILPLSACRQAMFAAKAEFLNQIRNKILKNVELVNQSSEVSNARLREITALIDYQTRRRRDYPTWPFDISMAQQVGLSFLLSVLPILINILFQFSNQLPK
ncbi:MAG TPA: hypothetical protein VK249_32155 [Anaerolineales bacterium]|nr:hypothetical protein [Anaerolineales bacterium]